MFSKSSKPLRQAQSIRLPLLALKRFCFLLGHHKKQKRTRLQGGDTLAITTGGSTLTGIALGLIASLPSNAYSAENPAVNSVEKLQVTTEMVIGSCPVDQLRNAYQNLIEDRELYNMSEAEKQMLLVCTERNAIVNDYIAAVENIIAKLQDLPDLNTQTQDSPNDGAGPLETVTLSPSSGAGTSAPPEAKPARSATPEAVEAQEPMTSEPKQATGFLRGTNGCTPRYSVIATGGNAERNTAMIADERAGDSYHVTVGQTMPCGVKVISIDDEVVVRDTLGDHVLPYVSDGWKNNDAGGYADDEFIFFKLEVKQTKNGVEYTKTAPETKVFGGYSLE